MTTHTIPRLIMRDVPLVGLTIAGAIAFPFLIHALPIVGDVPMGARLLPIFFAPLLAILLTDHKRGLIAALITSLFAPWLNNLLFGMPTPPMVTLLTLELMVFSIVSAIIYRQWSNFWAVALVGVGIAKLASLLFLTINPVIPAPPVSYGTNSFITGLPGILTMLLIGYMIHQYRQTNTER